MEKKERLKYLLKSVLGVDIDAIAAKTIASIAVQRAKQVPYLTREWLKSKERTKWTTYAYQTKK
ncbi:MAG: hypothetical protein ACE5QF_03520 [Thermoplasmata archaeon]